MKWIEECSNFENISIKDFEPGQIQEEYLIKVSSFY